jgi:hypothetical protein
VRGIPAIIWINVSILKPLYACEDHLTSLFAG